MSDCKNKDCKDCNEDYLQGMQPCVTLPELCVDGETCEETYNANCVRYTGSPVVCGTTTVLSTGMTTQQALISLANAICLSGGGGLTDLTALEQCCATNTTNITNLQTNLSIVNSTLTSISTQITTINTQITALQECCDNSVKRCDFFEPSYVILGCSDGEDIFSSDMFYVDKMNAGMSPTTFSQQTNTFGGRRLPLGPTETASAFFVEAGWTTFGLSWRYPVENDYYKSIQAIYGGTPIPHDQTYLLTKNVTEIIGVQGCAGLNTFNNNHINVPNDPIRPLLMTSIGVQGVASFSNIANIGGDFLSLWRNFQTSPNTAIRGKASGSNLNSGYDIEVGLTTDTNRANVGGNIVVKSGAGGTNHGLKIDVSQALGVTYAVQLKDTTAAAGKFLKAIDSDGNAIWDTVTAGGTVPPGVVSNNNINGTPNYVTKWTAADQIGDSQIIDDGATIAIGTSIDPDSKVNILTNTSNGIFVENTNATGGTGVRVMLTTPTITGTHFGFYTIINDASNSYGLTAIVTATNEAVGAGGNASGALLNKGLYGAGTSDINTSSKNYGVEGTAFGGIESYGGKFEARNGSTHSIGIWSRVPATSVLGNKYSVKLEDGTESVVGRYLRNMTTDGKGNWANINITEVTNGLSSTLLGAPNGIATLDNNSKLVMSQMPITVMDYKGTFNPTVPSPALQDGVGNTGDVYAVTAAGTYTFGAGNTLTLGVGDWVIYNGTKWEKTLGNNVGAGTVTSVGLTVGTTGTDVNISNSPITTSGAIALNIPTASSTARGVLSIADWNTFNGKVSAVSGTNNYIAKFTPNGTTIGNSQIQDNGSSIGIFTSPGANVGVYVEGNTTTHNNVIIGNAFKPGAIGVEGASRGAGSLENVGVRGIATSSTLRNFGGYMVAGAATVGENIGLYARATAGATNYAIQLVDGTELVAGRFLKNMTTDGKAQWANITAADVSGAVGAVNGTNNYVAKFTPDGTTIGNSLIQDNGTSIGVSVSPNLSQKLTVQSNGNQTAIRAFGNGDGFAGVYGSNTTTNNGTNLGLVGEAANSSNINIAIRGLATSGIGTNHAIQLQDGTQTVGGGKFLRDMGDGKANWAYLPDSAQLMCSDMTTPITASTALAKSFWIAPCNGQLTDIFANLYSPQAGGAIFTVNIKMNGATIASPSFTAGAQQSSIIAASNTFTKGTLFEVFVTQVGDGSAKGLLATINYLRT